MHSKYYLDYCNMTEPELIKACQNAAKNNSIEQFEYILSSKELTENIPFDRVKISCFLIAFKNNHKEFIEYLFFDKNLVDYKNIDFYIESEKNLNLDMGRFCESILFEHKLQRKNTDNLKNYKI